MSQKHSDDNEVIDLTNLKLQKLLYYFQGYTLAYFEKPLFKNNIINWKHGPVVEDVYYEFQKCGRDPVYLSEGDLLSGGKFDYSEIKNNKIMKRFLTDVFEYYAKYSASNLRNKTHNEDPWMDTKNREIMSNTSLQDYFIKLIDSDDCDFEDKRLIEIAKESEKDGFATQDEVEIVMRKIENA